MDFDRNLSVNAIRMLGVQAINAANSGHPGIVLDAAPITYALYSEILKVDPASPKWMDRDRFVLSAGHGSALLYSTLHLAGFPISIYDLKQFRQLHSITPGHPEYGLTAGVEATTGPLGQGIAMAVGMALAEQWLAATYNQPDFEIINHYTYALCGDGDLEEGVSQEAIAFAGRQQLSKLIVIYDSNRVQLDSMVDVVQHQNVREFFEAYYWDYIEVKDGMNYAAITAAIKQAQKNNRPTLIEAHTIMAYGAKEEGTPHFHGQPLGDEIEQVAKFYHWDSEPFTVPESVTADFKTRVQDRGAQLHQEWNKKFAAYEQKFPELAAKLKQQLTNKFKIDLTALLKNKPDKPEATRTSSGKILNALSAMIPNLIGGSADLSGSTKAKGADGTFAPTLRTGRNIMFGVREFAMGAIVNGINLHQGLRGFGSTFFTFSDYMKNSLRMAALMQLPSLFIFTHDSIAVGEDGPTHEPVEQLAALRSIPNFSVFRPADYQETVASYLASFNFQSQPSAIVCSRQNLPQLANSSVEKALKGGYVASSEAPGQLDVILVATGSEVHLAVDAQAQLRDHNINARVVSLPCWNLFLAQPEPYQEKILPYNIPTVAIEAASPFGWARFTGRKGLIIGVDQFGQSGPGDQVLAEYGFSPAKVVEQVKAYLQKKTTNKR